MAFRDLDEFLVVEPLVLPIRGKQYALPGEVSAKLWLQLQRFNEQIQHAQRAAETGEEYDPDEVALNDEDQATMMREMLGDVEAEMVADGCTSTEIRVVFFTCIAFHLSGREAAEAVWDAQGEAPSPERATRRSKAPTKATRSRGTSRAKSNEAPKTEVTSQAGETSSGTGEQ